MPTIIGVDLGTTNSLVAYADKGVPTVLGDPKTGDALVPSIVYFPESGAPVVGAHARAHLSAEPARTIYSAKRLMGRGLAHVRGDASASTLRLGKHGPDSLIFEL